MKLSALWAESDARIISKAKVPSAKPQSGVTPAARKFAAARGPESGLVAPSSATHRPDAGHRSKKPKWRLEMLSGG
jgi:hypothetical protein